MTYVSTPRTIDPRLTIGTCLSTTFAVFGRNFLPFMALGLVIGLPGLGISLKDDLLPSETGAGYSASGFVDMFASALTAGVVVYGTFQDLRGAPASFGAIFNQGASSIGRIVLASLVASLAVVLGTLLLVVPGIMIAMALWVYVPAIVIERKKIFESFSRSSELTKGRRWIILGVSAILFTAFAVALLGVNFLFLPSDESAAGSGGAVVVDEILIYVLAAAYNVVSAVASTVGYYLLRAEKEGVDIDEIAKVFD